LFLRSSFDLLIGYDANNEHNEYEQKECAKHCSQNVPLTSTWVNYGPWYARYTDASGSVKIEVDQSLVPWNFEKSSNSSDGIVYDITADGWATNLNQAGNERLLRTLSPVEYLDTATIVVAGFPEFGPASPLGYNSNITSISVDFSLGGVKTTYNLGTYIGRPGTYRKSDYDDLSKSRIDTREKLPEVENINLRYQSPLYDGTHRFPT